MFCTGVHTHKVRYTVSRWRIKVEVKLLVLIIMLLSKVWKPIKSVLKRNICVRDLTDKQQMGIVYDASVHPSIIIIWRRTYPFSSFRLIVVARLRFFVRSPTDLQFRTYSYKCSSTRWSSKKLYHMTDGCVEWISSEVVCGGFEALWCRFMRTRGAKHIHVGRALPSLRGVTQNVNVLSRKVWQRYEVLNLGLW